MITTTPVATTARSGTTAPLRVLFLEDDPDFPELAKSYLENDGFRVTMAVVLDLAAFVAALEKDTFDIILADYQLPTCNGLQALRAAREKSFDTPFVLVSGAIGEETAIESLKSGATDYVLKTGLNRLVPAVRRAVHETAERKRAAEDLNRAQAELALASRLAGMAEVATSVLHNVSNVLNSVNISVGLVSDELKKSRIADIARVAALLREHTTDIGRFMTHDPKGKQLPDYLSHLADYLQSEQGALLQEMEQIKLNVEHIKDIVAIQQNYSQISGTSETVRVMDLVEDAVRLNAGALLFHNVQIVREYEPDLPDITVERHKVLQILLNLIHNAKYACAESTCPEKRVTLRVRRSANAVSIAVIDNGVGISPENFARVFSQGFTTRKGGHGFKLHSSALAAQSLGGTLHAHSEGSGQGATFTLELPLTTPSR